MEKNVFLHEQLQEKFRMPHLARYPSLPLTPASILWNERKFLNFCSHDYLGLSQHAELRKNAIKYLLHYGVGICDPEMENGYLECQQKLEEKCAEALNVSNAHLFSTRSAALYSILRQFPHCEWTLHIDAAAHPSLFTAAQLWNGNILPFPHRNLPALDAHLLASDASKSLILSESLCAFTGHNADLKGLIHLSQAHEAFLIIDDSSAFGVKGHQGFGYAQGMHGIDFIICALDEGAGASGALAACSKHIAPHFFHDSSFSRETAVCFSTLGAIEASLELIPALEGERMQLEQRTHWIRQQLTALELPLIPSSSHLIAIACDSVQDAQQRCNALLEHDILAKISRVDSNQTYLHFAINSYHTPDELSMLVHAFETADHSL